MEELTKGKSETRIFPFVRDCPWPFFGRFPEMALRLQSSLEVVSLNLPAPNATHSALLCDKMTNSERPSFLEGYDLNVAGSCGLPSAKSRCSLEIQRLQWMQFYLPS